MLNKPDKKSIFKNCSIPLFRENNKQNTILQICKNKHFNQYYFYQINFDFHVYTRQENIYFAVLCKQSPKISNSIQNLLLKRLLLYLQDSFHQNMQYKNRKKLLLFLRIEAFSQAADKQDYLLLLYLQFLFHFFY